MNRRDFIARTAGAALSLGLPSPVVASPSVQVFSDPAMLRHQPPPDHPESPRRLETVMQTVRKFEADGAVALVTPRTAT